ncbi:Transthyretin-like family protein [Cooperia oncophora]
MMIPGPDLDDLMAEGTTDSMGQFLLFGHTSEPCQRKVSFFIPKDYVSSGEQPKKFFDIGHINMQIQFKSEERDCLHRR